MDVSVLMTSLLSLACAGLGWWLRILWDAQVRLKDDLAELERGLPVTYVRRDDFKDTVAQLNGRFDRIEQKLDKLIGDKDG